MTGLISTSVLKMRIAAEFTASPFEKAMSALIVETMHVECGDSSPLVRRRGDESPHSTTYVNKTISTVNADIALKKGEGLLRGLGDF